MLKRLYEISEIQADVEGAYLFIMGNRDCFALSRFKPSFADAFYIHIADDPLDDDENIEMEDETYVC